MRTIKTILTSMIILATVGLFAQNMKVDVKNSVLKWHGEKVTGEHFGTIDLKKGWLSWDSDKISDGEFVIDMTTIANTDLEGTEYKAKLEGHLKSDDFFGIEKFPTAKLVINGSDTFKHNEANVTAHLTIKEITHPVEFEVKKDGNWFMAEIVVNRSKYDVRYGSGSFFDNLGDKMIYDDFTMTVKIATIKDETAGL